MSPDYYRSELARLIKEEAGLRKDLARHEDGTAKARAAAHAKRRSASGSRSTLTISMYLSGAESEEKKSVEAAKKAAGVQEKLATNASRQREKQRGLESAVKSERSSKDRADEIRRRKEKEHVREIARLSRPTVHHILIPTPEPEKLRVLYLTASPPGHDALRVDVEVNSVLRAVRGSKHRDLIDILHRPAAAPQDLVDGLNDHRPHVVHFSGHGGAPGLFFDNASVSSPSVQLVGYRQLAKLLRATECTPTCVLLNACDTTVGALELLEAVPIVIAMNAPVEDPSASVFATQFYAAVGGGQPVGIAVEQAVAMTEIALSTEMDLVTLCTRPEVDASVVKLIEPSNSSA